MYQDPLAAWKIESLSKVVEPFAEKYGYKILPNHIHEAVLAFIFYQSIFIISGFLSPKLSKGYNTLTTRTKLNFDIHVVSQVQCILILIISYPLFSDPVLALDHVTGYTPYGGLVGAFALGYFAWDSYVCLRYMNLFGPGFAVHGVASFFVFLQGTRPFLMYYSPHFLLFELSTPFLNVHWFASHLPAGTVSKPVQIINNLFLLLSFFSARIVWGFYQAYFVAADVFSKEYIDKQPLWCSISVSVANISLNTLNIYWFSKMLQIASRVIFGKSARNKKES